MYTNVFADCGSAAERALFTVQEERANGVNILNAVVVNVQEEHSRNVTTLDLLPFIYFPPVCPKEYQ